MLDEHPIMNHCRYGKISQTKDQYLIIFFNTGFKKQINKCRAEGTITESYTYVVGKCSNLRTTSSFGPLCNK